MNSKEISREIEHFTKLVEEQEVSWWGNFTPAGKKRLKNRCEIAVNLCKLDRSKHVLELGCGMGPFTQYLASSGARIVAIDITPALIKLAQERIKKSNVTFEIANAYELPFESGTFDVALGYGILHHLNLDKVLPEIKRVIKTGAKIVFFEPNLLNPQVFLEKKIRFIGERLQNSPGETAFVRWCLKRKFEEHGYKKIVIKPFDFLHPATPEIFIPLADTVSRFLERIPIIKEIGGSLIIYAEN